MRTRYSMFGERAMNPGETYSPEVLTQMAPEHRDNQAVVPKVVE